MKLLTQMVLISAITGVANAEVGTPRVIGGSDEDASQWPAVAMIVRKDPANQNFFLRPQQPFCVGALIAPQWVVTAAHCFRAIRPGESNVGIEDIQVVFGVSNWRTREAFEQAIDVTQMVVHPNFPRTEVAQIFDDIALIKLETAQSTSPLSLDACSNPANTRAHVLGWGANALQNGDFVQATPILQHAELPTAQFEQCNSAYGNTLNANHHQCVGTLVGGIDSCAGDSGGPLLIEHNGRISVDGVLSFGPAQCGAPESPAVYTYTRSYLDWIEQSIGEPITRNHQCDEVKYDTDLDLVPDSTETQEGSDASDGSSFVDQDQDGVPNFIEQLQQTDALNRQSYLDSNNDGKSDYQTWRDAQQPSSPPGGDSGGGSEGLWGLLLMMLASFWGRREGRP